MANPFDAFDETAAAAPAMPLANPFDAFDTQKPRLAQTPGEDARRVVQGLVDTGKAIVTDPVGLAKSVGSTIGDATYGLASKIAAPVISAFSNSMDPERAGVEAEYQKARRAHDERGVNAIGSGIDERYGSFSKIKDSILKRPLSTALDASMLMSGGATLPGRVGTVFGALDPVSVAGKTLTTAPGYVGSTILGRTSGVGGKVVRQAFEDSAAGGPRAQAFKDNYTGAKDAQDLRDLGNSALDKMRVNRSNQYQSGMASTNANQTPLSYTPIDTALSDAQKKIISSNGFVKDPVAQKKLQEMRDIIDDHQTTPGQAATPADFDALKQRLGVVQQNTDHTSLSRNVTNQVYNAVKDEIVGKAPGYAKTMDEYSAASQKLAQLQKTFSLAEGSSTDTAARKLLSTARHNVTTNFGYRDKLMKELAQHEPTLPSAIAGQTLNSLQPRGLIANGELTTAGVLALMHNPALLAALPAFSPKAVGGAAYAAGMVPRAANAVGVTGPRIRKSILALNAARVPGLLEQ